MNSETYLKDDPIISTICKDLDAISYIEKICHPSVTSEMVADFIRIRNVNQIKNLNKFCKVMLKFNDTIGDKNLKSIVVRTLINMEAGIKDIADDVSVFNEEILLLIIVRWVDTLNKSINFGLNCTRFALNHKDELKSIIKDTLLLQSNFEWLRGASISSNANSQHRFRMILSSSIICTGFIKEMRLIYQ